MNAALPGDITSWTGGMVPVIGVPLPSEHFPNCLDALLAMIQMPPGLPVAVPGLGSVGFQQAILLAAEMLAMKNDRISSALAVYRASETKKAKPRAYQG